MRKVCKNCRVFVKGNSCPLCGGTSFTTTWNGRTAIFDTESEIAKSMGIQVKGEYAMQVRT